MKTITNSDAREIVGFLEKLITKDAKNSKKADINRRLNKLIRKLK